MKLGLDIHGVIDKIPCLSIIAEVLVSAGHEVHIITGAPLTSISDGKFTHDGIENYLMNLGFIKGKTFTHFYSIVDYHRELGTAITNDERGFWIDPLEWDKAKSDYCRSVNIDLHIDDSMEYAKYFTTPICIKQ